MITQSQQLAQQLDLGLNQMGLALQAEVKLKLIEYLLLLIKWNAAYNLTAHQLPQEMVVRHLLDSLAIVPWVVGSKVLDLGSGGGLPGIPLALVSPDQQFVLLDSNGKKTRFLTQVVHALNLPNVEVVQNRVENYLIKDCFNIVLTRAFSTIANVLKLTANLCCSDGKFLFMKGIYPKEELTDLPHEWQVEQVIPLNVPGLNAERHLVIIVKKNRE